MTGWAFPRCPVCGGDGENNHKWIHLLCQTLGLAHDALLPPPGWKPIQPSEENPEPGVSPEDLKARFELLNQVYGHISRTTGLTKEHKEHLEVRRGLTHKQIKRAGFFSVERVSHEPYKGMPGTEEFHMPGVPKEILRELPGFYMRSNRRKQKKKPGEEGLPEDKPEKYLHFRPSQGHGIFIPVRDARGRIIGGQIRRMEAVVEKGQSYRWLQYGGTWPHVPLDFQPSEEIWITGGALKAIVATALGQPCISVPSINGWKKPLHLLKKWLKEWKPRRVVIAFDADQWSVGDDGKWRPSDWIEKFVRELRQTGYEVMAAFWSFAHPHLKGLDDLLFEGHRPELVPVFDLDAERRPLIPNSPLELVKGIKDTWKWFKGTVLEEVFLSDPKARILYALLKDTDGGPVTCTEKELVKRTGLKRTTLRRHVEDMLRDGQLDREGDTYYVP